MTSPEVIRPQPGPQSEFLRTKADIAIYGGAAGGGKTFGLLLEPLRHHNNPKFSGVIFRETAVQIKNPGALWDQSLALYGRAGAKPREHTLEWNFHGEKGMQVKFSHLEHEKDVLNWQGAQIPFIGFDELTHFSETQFSYMQSRLRSDSGVRGYIRATCNPDPDSFVRRLIDWWIGADGFAIPERAGKLRWFIRRNDAYEWADSEDEIYARFGHGPEILPKSLTFIPSKLEDNQILMQKDPSYLSSLLALNRVDRMRLREGNWNVRASAGMLFQREWFSIIDTIPAGWIKAIRFWDRAATRPSESNRDPDWTRGLKLLKYSDGTYCVVDLKSMRDTPGQVETLIKNVASHDTVYTRVKSQQDPGSAGVAEAEHFIRMLQGYDVRTETMPKDKVTRAKPVSAQSEAHNIRVLRAPWNEEFFSELENFPDEASHDDIVDVLSGAFNDLCEAPSILDLY